MPGVSTREQREHSSGGGSSSTHLEAEVHGVAAAGVGQCVPAARRLALVQRHPRTRPAPTGGGGRQRWLRSWRPTGWAASGMDRGRASQYGADEWQRRHGRRRRQRLWRKSPACSCAPWLSQLRALRPPSAHRAGRRALQAHRCSSQAADRPEMPLPTTATRLPSILRLSLQVGGLPLEPGLSGLVRAAQTNSWASRGAAGSGNVIQTSQEDNVPCPPAARGRHEAAAQAAPASGGSARGGVCNARQPLGSRSSCTQRY